MRPLHYLGGLLVLAVMVGAVAVVGVTVRRRLLGSWTGPHARLAECVVGIATLLVVAQVLGTVGGLRRDALLVGCVVAAVGAATVGRGGRPPRSPPVEAPRPGRWQLAAAGACGTVVVTAWIGRTYRSLTTGMLDYDTLWYHMPFAATFAQSGSVTALTDVGNPPSTYFPANSELLHAVGLLAFGNDVASPLVNLGWLALALLAAWCIGRPHGAGPLALSVVALVLVLPVMAHGGKALNDVVGLALLLASVALLGVSRLEPVPTAIAGVAAGLALGTKVTFIAPVLGLGAAVLWLAWARRRRFIAALWAAATLVFGAFWYMRNAAVVGNPFPWFDIGAGPLRLPSLSSEPADCGTTSVAGYPGGLPAVVRDLVPQLPTALTHWGWVLVALGVTGGLVGLAGRSAPARLLGVGGLVAMVAYLVTPATAGGSAGDCFAYNLRTLAPGLTLGMLALVVAAASRARLRRTLVGAVPLLVTLVFVSAADGPIESVPALLGAVVGVGMIAPTRRRNAWRQRRWSARPAAAAVASATAALIVIGFPVQQQYLEQRYVGFGIPPGSAPELGERQLREVAALQRATIAVSGLLASYPLYGADASNRVRFVASPGPGADFTYATGCREWQRLVVAGGFDHVVLGTGWLPASDEATAAEPDELAWTLGLPGARILVGPPGGYVIRLEPSGRAMPATARCTSRARD